MNDIKMTRFLPIAVALLGILVSCVPQEEMDKNAAPAFLELSHETIELTNQKVDMGDVPQVTIKTNQSVVKAVSLDPNWLQVKCRNGGIYFSALENRSRQERETHILVVAGEARALIKVTQSNATTLLDVSPKDAELSPEGESFLIDVLSNGSKWTYEIEDKEEWLKVSRIDDFLQVTAEANVTLAAREAQIYVTLAEKVLVINLTQQPSNRGAKYALPLLERRGTPYSIIAFEEENSNYLLEYSGEANLLGEPGEVSLKFVYASSVYSNVVYNVNTISGLITKIVMTSYKPHLLESNEFMDFLAFQGFSISNNTSNVTSQMLNFSGSNADAAYGVDININKDNTKPSTITLKSRGRQTEPHKTFATFPFDKYEYLLDGWTYAKIKESELADGSTLDYETPSAKDPNVIRESQFSVAPQSRPLVARIFGMNEDKIDPETGTTADRLDQLVAVFDDVHLGAFVADGKYFLTEEFQDLLVSSGFRYVKEQDGLTQWYHDGKKLLIIPRGTRFSSVMDLMPVLAISYFHRDLSQQTEAQINATLSESLDVVMRQDRVLGLQR